MYTLYLKFVQQVKQQEIISYNQRHRDYLVRSGKLQPQKQKESRPVDAKPRRQQPTQNTQQTVRNTKPQPTIISANDERPLKGSNGYNIPQDGHPFESKPIKPNHNMQRTIQNTEQSKPKVETRPLPPPEQVPIKPNLTVTSQTTIIAKSTKEIDPPLQYEQVVLVQCPQGCGKKFNERALQKHVRICGKQVKRKVFHAKVVDDEAAELKKQQKVEKKPAKGIPKWKMDSNKFRNAIMQQKALQNGLPPPASLPEIDQRVQCPGCGRKFNAEPAAKHIPLCVKKNSMKR